MTKRALIIIALLFLIPIIITTCVYNDFKKNNPVVAEYDGDVRTIKYGDLILHAVPDDNEYSFRFGEYLGKVGDRVTGASFYLVADDATGKYYAIADGDRKVLYTESGELIDGYRQYRSNISRVVFDDYKVVEEGRSNVRLLAEIEHAEKTVSVDLSKYVKDSKKLFTYYDLYLSFDGSAILTEYYGRLICLNEKNKWIFVDPDEVEFAQEEYGSDISATVYSGLEISDVSTVKLLRSYFDDSTAETTASETAE